MRNFVFIVLFALSAMLIAGCSISGGKEVSNSDIISNNENNAAISSGNTDNALPIPSIEDSFPSAPWQSTHSNITWEVRYTNVSQKNMDKLIADLNATGNFSCIINEGLFTFTRCTTADYEVYFYHGEGVYISYNNAKDSSTSYLKSILLPVHGVMVWVSLRKIFSGDIRETIRNHESTQFADFTCTDRRGRVRTCSNLKDDKDNIDYFINYGYNDGDNSTWAQWLIGRRL